MAFDEHLATRMREIIARASPDAIEKSMFGGLAFMLQGKMFAGIVKDELTDLPIAAAAVLLENEDFNYTTQTDANGIFPTTATGLAVGSVVRIRIENYQGRAGYIETLTV